MAGVSNVDIEKYFQNESNEDLKKNFKCVMSSNSMTKLVNFNKILKTNQSLYPFIIMNTSRKNKKGVHWWSILNIDPKKELLLFDSYEFIGFKVFILSHDKAIVDKILYNVNNFNQKDNKINLVTVTFSVDA